MRKVVVFVVSLYSAVSVRISPGEPFYMRFHSRLYSS